MGVPIPAMESLIPIAMKTRFMRQLLAHLPNRTRTLFRGDSGFFVGDLLDFLEERGHGYLIKVKLKGLASLLETQKWQKVKGQPAWEGCEFSHTAPLGTGHHAQLSCPNGRKMDEWRSSTKTESSGKNTLQCSMGCMGRCWRDLDPLFHSSGYILLRCRFPNPGKSTS